MKLKNLIPPILVCAVICSPSFVFAGPLNPESETLETAPASNLYAENFYIPSTQKLDQKITEVRGFPVIKTHSRTQNAEYSIITDFGGNAVRSRFLPGMKEIPGPG